MRYIVYQGDKPYNASLFTFSCEIIAESNGEAVELAAARVSSRRIVFGKSEDEDRVELLGLLCATLRGDGRVPIYEINSHGAVPQVLVSLASIDPRLAGQKLELNSTEENERAMAEMTLGAVASWIARKNWHPIIKGHPMVCVSCGGPRVADWFNKRHGNECPLCGNSSTARERA